MFITHAIFLIHKRAAAPQRAFIEWNKIVGKHDLLIRIVRI